MQHFGRFAHRSNPCHILPRVLLARFVVASFFANFEAQIKVQQSFLKLNFDCQRGHPFAQTAPAGWQTGHFYIWLVRPLISVTWAGACFTGGGSVWMPFENSSFTDPKKWAATYCFSFLSLLAARRRPLHYHRLKNFFLLFFASLSQHSGCLL